MARRRRPRRARRCGLRAPGLEALGRDDLIDELAGPRSLFEWYRRAAELRQFVPPSRGFSSDPEKYQSFDDDTLRGLQRLACSASPRAWTCWVQTACADRRARSRCIRSSCRTST